MFLDHLDQLIVLGFNQAFVALVGIPLNRLSLHTQRRLLLFPDLYHIKYLINTHHWYVRLLCFSDHIVCTYTTWECNYYFWFTCINHLLVTNKTSRIPILTPISRKLVQTNICSIMFLSFSCPIRG